jgi:hypothetical protein
MMGEKEVLAGYRGEPLDLDGKMLLQACVHHVTRLARSRAVGFVVGDHRFVVEDRYWSH